jgi:dTDP-glucose 4,6-dehydratase
MPSPDCAAVQGRLQEILHHLAVEELEGQTLFLTGGTGFFGFWLLSLLDLVHQQGVNFEVQVLSRRPDQFLASAPFFATKKWLRLQQGDVKTYQPTGPASLLIHAATDTHAQAHTHPLAIVEDVLQGTQNCLNQASRQGVRRALFVSSGAIYGRQAAAREPTPESARIFIDPDQPPNYYGEAKRMAEHWATLIGQSAGMVVPIARCFAFVGPAMDLNGHFAIGNFIRDGLRAKTIQVQGDGTPVRSYLYGADLAIWLLQMLLKGQHGRPYNVGSDQGISIRELAELTRQILSPEKTVSIAQRPVDNPLRSWYVPSITRARTELNLDVWTPLSDAIGLTAKDAPP